MSLCHEPKLSSLCVCCQEALKSKSRSRKETFSTWTTQNQSDSSNRLRGLQLKYSHKKRRNDCSIRTQKYRSFHCRHGLVGFFITSLEAGIPACTEYCATSRTQIIQFIPVTGEMVSLIGAAKGVVRSAIRELGKTETQPQQQELQNAGKPFKHTSKNRQGVISRGVAFSKSPQLLL